MQMNHENRTHGDGRLFMEDFDRPLTESETTYYRQLLSTIMAAVNAEITVQPDTTEETELLTALRQRFEIAFSNGCPWPEKTLTEHLQAHPAESPAVLTDHIRDSFSEDGATSFLYQLLVDYANPQLQRRLTNYYPATPVDGQEDRHLPATFTEQGLAFGLAYDELFYQVVLPLRELIDHAVDPKQTTQEVLRFMEQAAEACETIEKLAEQTGRFLHEQQSPLESALKTTTVISN